MPTAILHVTHLHVTPFSGWRRVLAEEQAEKERVMLEEHRGSSRIVERMNASLADDLPDGWLAHADADGRTFYHHAAFNETSWERPIDGGDEQQQAGQQVGLPPGWTVHTGDDGRTFFHHAASGETSWERPPPPSSVETLPGGWVKLFSEEHQGRPYWHHAATDRTVWEEPKYLPKGWAAVKDPSTGKLFYRNAWTGETSWTVPVIEVTLPHGWTELTHEATGVPYYHNSISGETSWSFPKEDAIVAASSSSNTTSPPSDSSSTTTSSSSSEEEDDDRRTKKTTKKKKKKKQKKYVRWKWTPRDDISLVDGLFASIPNQDGKAAAAGGEVAAADRRRSSAVDVVKLSGPSRTYAMIPPYLLEMFNKLFAITNRSGSGAISTLELSKMLKARAKHTGLDGDATAIFKLKTHMATQAAASSRDLLRGMGMRGIGGGRQSATHKEIGEKEFANGIMKALAKEPNGE